MLQCCIHMRALQAGGALAGQGTIRRGGRQSDAGGAGGIRVQNQVQPATCGVVQPDLGGAIHPADGGLAEFRVQNLRGGAHQALGFQGGLQESQRVKARWRRGCAGGERA